MPQSLVNNYVHIVFSTKHREPLIYPPYDQKLYAYMAGICDRLESPALKINGYLDHVHILCNLSRKIPLMTLLEKVKANSSKWVKDQDISLGHFYWQDGYAAFSVGKSEIKRIKNYIDNQHSHHESKGYKEEFRYLMAEHKIEFDEKYVWD